MKLLVIGGGDLSQRVIALLPPAIVNEVLIVTRGAERGTALARLFGGCLPVLVRHVLFEPTTQRAMVDIIRRERPDMVFHAASLISPWLLPERQTAAAAALQAAGFGLMLPAQLPLIRMVMGAIRETGLICPVVNASFPDLTHPVLATEGLDPTIGVGNAGMLFNVLLGALRARAIDVVPQLFGHHAQVTPFARHGGYVGPAPWLFVDGDEDRLDAYVDGPLPSGRLLNALTAAHAVEIIAALAAGSDPLRTAAPGPGGLPGGWPVVVTEGRVALDLPSAVSMDAALRYQARAATGDGVAGIDPDGTVHFTDDARSALAPIAPRLAEPLRRDDLAARFEALQRLVAT